MDTRWSLDELLTSADEEALRPHLAEIERYVTEVERYRQSLSPDIAVEDFLRILGLIESMARVSQRLQGYATLRFSADTGDQSALALMGRLDETFALLMNRTLFFGLWCKSLDDASAERLIAHAGDFTYYLRQQRLFKKHVLTEPEEKIVNLKDLNGSTALTTLYDMITNKFKFTLTVDGAEHTLTRDALMSYVRNPSPEVREAAYREQFRLYGQESPVLGQIYAHRVRDWATENVDLRGIASPIAVRNLANDIPDSVVDTLLGVCEEKAGVFHSYFKMKASWLGLPRLRRFDIYAPLGGGASKKIEYDEAVATVLESFGRFSPEFLRHARRVFDDRHVDAEIRPGKRGGAFCYSIHPELAPWVLLNYTGEPREVATLAHELGHAVHSLMAEQHNAISFHSALPLAETASVFAEMLLTDHLLASVTDPLVTRDIVSHAVDDMYATVLRQAFFVIFEREAHAMLRDGATVDQVSARYMQLLQRQFGDSVALDDVFKHEWVSIPHLYHAPFYCYAYSFGMLLSLSLYARYKKEGGAFVQALLRILSHGGSASPAFILTEAGVDMTDPEFWKSGFGVIEEMIGRLSAD